jgi:ribosomal protein S18 acetylase RimI-like enzyme
MPPIGKILRATPSEATLVRTIGQMTYREHYAHLWHPPAMEAWLDQQFAPQRLAQELASDQIHYYYVRAGQQIMGLMKLAFGAPMLPQKVATGLLIEKIYLLREATGQGLGQQMLHLALDQGQASGEPFCWLCVLQSNERGIRFYQAQGFQIVGHTMIEADLAKPDLWVMQRLLG